MRGSPAAPPALFHGVRRSTGGGCATQSSSTSRLLARARVVHRAPPARTASALARSRCCTAAALAPHSRAHTARTNVAAGSTAPAAVVASNVPGPPVALHLGGRAVTALHFAAPSPGAVPVSACVISYAGALSLMVLADARLRVDPETLAALFVEELTALVALPPRSSI